MASIINTLDAIASEGWPVEWGNPGWKQFILTGEERYLTELPEFREFDSLPEDLLAALPVATEIDDGARRFLRACLAAGHPSFLGEWIGRCVKRDKPSGNEFNRACAVALEIGCPSSQIAMEVAKRVRPLRGPEGNPCAAGGYILELNDTQLEEVFCKLGRDPKIASELAALLVIHAPARWKRILEHFNQSGQAKRLSAQIWLVSLAESPGAFLTVAANAFELLTIWNSKFELGIRLHELDPNRFVLVMTDLAIERMIGEDTKAQCKLWEQARDSAAWLLGVHGPEAVPRLKAYFSAPLERKSWNRQRQSEYKIFVLELAVPRLGRGVVPLLKACFTTPQLLVQFRALELWTQVRAPEDSDFIAAMLRQFLRVPDVAAVSKAIRLAGELVSEATEEDLWRLLSNESQAVRDQAAAVIARFGESRLSRVPELWADENPRTRLGTISWLSAVGTVNAVAALTARLGCEEDDGVRDSILTALEKLPGGPWTLGADELETRIKKALEGAVGSPVPWLDPAELPSCKLSDGSSLPPEWLKYLLIRQARNTEMRVDPEARSLYALIDRMTSGDLGLAVVRSFINSGSGFEDRWAMAFSAIVGDDRLVPVLAPQILEWADHDRRKLAAQGAQALALLGTDAALIALNSLSIRYSSCCKNVGQTARKAFEKAVNSRGVASDALGDLVVPWFGFTRGQPKIVEIGALKIEVLIGTDFNLSYRDLTTGKILPELPDLASTEVKSEFNKLLPCIKAACDSLSVCLESMMLRQVRWTIAEWMEHFAIHPLLRPFLQCLIWGVYDHERGLTGSFRARDDGPLTDVANAPFELPLNGEVGIVHPVDLTSQTLALWSRSLAEGNVIPPFPQLERSCIRVTPGSENTTIGREVAKIKLNAETFKDRAERLGWEHGSIYDGGIANYLKCFPAAGVDVYVDTEGLFPDKEPDLDFTLGRIFFLKHASVLRDQYGSDEPDDPDDPRLFKYGDVPPIVFAEAMGDLMKISEAR